MAGTPHCCWRESLNTAPLLQPLLHREVLGVPMSTLKYAMTLDGKIATHTGHSAWVSNAASRQRVFEQRAASDTVIVGGNTVRRDNPRLTTRRESGHFPTRVIMTRCLDLPPVRPRASRLVGCWCTDMIYRIQSKAWTPRAALYGV